MDSYVCSRCGAGAYYDGRCGDGPVLMCGCDQGRWIDDGRGGYYDNPTGASAVHGAPRPSARESQRISDLEAENRELRARIRRLEEKTSRKRSKKR